MLMIFNPRTFPRSRRMPQFTVPTPAWPPPTKPPSVASLRVEGCMRISRPFFWSSWSKKPSLIPACARTAPGFCQTMRSRPSISTTAPPASGTAWPKLPVPPPRATSGTRCLAQAAAMRTTSSSFLGDRTTSAVRPARAADMIGLNQLKSALLTRRAAASREWEMSPRLSTKEFISAFTPNRALVPAAQREMVDQRQEDENQDAGARDHEERREHARDLQLVAGLEDAVGEPGLDAARAGDELGHHRADQRQAAADAQAAEEKGQRARQAQVPEHLAARGAVELQQVEQVVVGAVQAERGIRHDREERH